MATINLSISSKVDSITHKAPILFRFVGGRGFIFRVKSGLYINPYRWSDKESRAIIPRLATAEQKELVRLQKQLDELSNIIIESFTNADKTLVSKQWLESIVDNYHFPNRQVEVEIQRTFFDVFNEYLTKRKLSEWRIRAYHVVIRALQRYELYKQAVTHKSFTLDFDTITPKTLQDYEEFLRSEHKFYDKYPAIYKAVPESRTPQPRGQNTINGILTKLRTLFIWAGKNG